MTIFAKHDLSYGLGKVNWERNNKPEKYLEEHGKHIRKEPLGRLKTFLVITYDSYDYMYEVLFTGETKSIKDSAYEVRFPSIRIY